MITGYQLKHGRAKNVEEDDDAATSFCHSGQRHDSTRMASSCIQLNGKWL